MEYHFKMIAMNSFQASCPIFEKYFIRKQDSSGPLAFTGPFQTVKEHRYSFHLVYRGT